MATGDGGHILEHTLLKSCSLFCSQGTELLVWYGDCYLQFMGIPVALKEMADGSQTEEIESKSRYSQSASCLICYLPKAQTNKMQFLCHVECDHVSINICVMIAVPALLTYLQVQAIRSRA